MDFIPSLTFQHTSEALHKKKLDGEIDEIELSKLLDELITQEIQNQQSSIAELVMQRMRETEYQKIRGYEEERRKAEEARLREITNKEQVRLRQQSLAEQKTARDEQQRVWTEQQQREKEASEKMQSRQYYRQVVVPGEIETLKKQYQQQQNRYTWLQLISIVASIAATSLVGIDVLPRWFIVIFSGAAAIATGLLSTFHIRESNYSYYQAISGMETASHDYDQRIGDYVGLDEDQAFQLFSSCIGAVKQQHASQQLAFWKTTTEQPVHPEESQRSLPAPAEELKEKTEEEASAEKLQEGEAEQEKNASNKESQEN